MIFENLVRPYQLPDNAPAKVMPFASPTRIPPLIKLHLGRSGVVQSFSGSLSASTTVYIIKYPREMILSDTISTALKAVMANWKPSGFAL